MNALAHRRFLKMNGLGNEITVLDLRGTKLRVAESDARAIAAEPRAHFDQLMVLHDSITPGTDAYVRIYNTDGSEAGACGNGTRCVAWAMLADPMMGDAAKTVLTLQTKAGCCRPGATATSSSPSTWVRRSSAGRTSRWPSPSTTPRIRASDRPDRRSDPPHALRRQHG